MSEALLQDQIRLALGSDPAIVLWRNNCGVAELRTGGRIRFGVGNPGGADLIGIFRGRFIAAEIKTPDGRQSPAQKTFQGCVDRHAGVYAILRSVADALAWLADLHTRYPA